MPLQATSGAASQDGFGGNGVPVVVNYIEDVFNTYLYTGNGSTQTITNGIDLSTKGGMVWIKSRSTADPAGIFDTARGATNSLRPSGTTANLALSGVTSFDATGFTLGSYPYFNGSGQTQVAWTFAEKSKFFDIVTWTGDGNATQTISHNLGSAPGFLTCKSRSTTGDWWSYHRGTSATPNNDYGVLNSSNAWNITGSNLWGVTSTTFLAQLALNLNTNGVTYIAYLFAHNAGGFGLTGTDNVISCGSFTTDGSGNATVDLGYEPQFVLYKATSTTGSWYMVDNMRGFSVTNSKYLSPNVSNAEADLGPFAPTSTGFKTNATLFPSVITYIYIAIRRGPMKVPTSGTSVFTPSTTSAGTNISVGFPSDLWIGNNADGDASGNNHVFSTRLQGQRWLRSPTTAAESAASGTILWDLQNSFRNDQFGGSRAEFLLARAPNFMDVVCYTGVGTSGYRAIPHNLTVTPELIIVKRRSAAAGWVVGSSYFTAGFAGNNYFLNTDGTTFGSGYLGGGTGSDPTATNFYVEGFGTSNDTDAAGVTYVAYLFATLAGVSKVGSYTGTGTTKQIDCGFTGGARLILIKRTDASGDWYIYNSASGISSGNDPYMLMNTTAAQVTGTDYIDTYSAGFEISSTAPSAINASGGTFIFLAIA